MTAERELAMTEEQIRARFRCAPDYYLAAKLEKVCMTQPAEEQDAAQVEPPLEVVVAAQSQPQAPVQQKVSVQPQAPVQPKVSVQPMASVQPQAPVQPKVSVQPQAPVQPQPPAQPQLRIEPRRQPTRIEPVSLDTGLPGLEILDAALFQFDYLAPSTDAHADPHSDLTQQSILESALADYANWPIVSASDLEPTRKPKLERKLKQMLESEPELEQMLDIELQSLSEELEPIPDNVTVGDFGFRAPRTVRVVSVVLDRKHPNMVRVVSESTRLAS